MVKKIMNNGDAYDYFITVLNEICISFVKVISQI